MLIQLSDKLSDVHSDRASDLQESVADLDLIIFRNNCTGHKSDDEAGNEDDQQVCDLCAGKALDVPVLGSDRKDQDEQDADDRQIAEDSEPEER